jgi:aminoglycoside phosphotransferase family enzyme
VPSSSPSCPVSLEEKVRFLSTRAAYPGLNGPVTALETHMSWVFLAGGQVFKLKKPVRFPYLDFSTLPLRERACRAELRLNRRLAPDVYLAVAPLTSDGVRLSIRGAGQIVDWLVEMRRLDETSALQARLADAAQPRELDRLAAALAAFYRRARPVWISSSSHLADWARALAYNRRVLLDSRFELGRGRIRWMDSVLRRFLTTRRRVLVDRIHHRRILDGHGDLRPEHIWMDRPIHIIDCLEFSTRLRALDPLDEIAFLDLECERFGAAAAGRRIRAGVSRALGEQPPPALYSFYRCYRGMLRARLSIAHLLEAAPRTPEKWPAQAKAYLAIAARDARDLERRLRRQ